LIGGDKAKDKSDFMCFDGISKCLGHELMLPRNISECNESDGQFDRYENPEDELGANVQNLIIAPRRY